LEIYFKFVELDL